jgi:hypothetical protein
MERSANLEDGHMAGTPSERHPLVSKAEVHLMCGVEGKTCCDEGDKARNVNAAIEACIGVRAHHYGMAVHARAAAVGCVTV